MNSFTLSRNFKMLSLELKQASIISSIWIYEFENMNQSVDLGI